MLKIINISKTYKTGNLIQKALDNVSLNLRDNEFIAVLGPSGSGKTTLLNIIGGLDHYDSGDLQINNVSTSNYKDRDWDAYRNHSIGFVFQSYNLIPHQTILSNVELALTIGGVSKKERIKKALHVLDEVGLKEQAHKKPNQLSGGQMQRVAIARALVNDPQILLADEPTGALDSKTSIQVMELLKEVAKDRLVVMVTHNPELAYKYANRIVKLQDGNIIDDSNPYIDDSEKKTTNKRIGNAKMNFFTALSLSFNNLLTKKGRTILTAFAGSIGIIGIALILALSQGFQNYIDKIQEDTLSSYPLTVTSETADATSAILSMVSDKEKTQDINGENVVEKRYLTNMFSSIGTNDLKSFKEYLENHEDDYKNDISLIKYAYSVTPNIYTIDGANKLTKLNPSSLMSAFYSDSAISALSSFSSASSSSIFSEMIDDQKSLEKNYDLLKGKWPTNYDEMIIVLSEKNSISDLLVYSLGLKDTNKLKSMMSEIMSGKQIENNEDPSVYTYDDLLNIELKLIDVSSTYQYNEDYNIYVDMSQDNDYMLELYDNSLTLKIVGIVCPKDNTSNYTLSAGVAYTKDLTNYVIEQASKSQLVQKQLANPDIDVISNKKFDEVNETNDETLNFEEMISIDEKKMQEAFKVSDTTNLLGDSTNTQNMILDKSKDVAKSIKEATSEALLATNEAYYQACLQLINTYNSMATYSEPNDCEYYVDSLNKSKGCALKDPNTETEVSNKDDYIEVNTIDLTNLSNPFTTIYVSKTLGYKSYTSYNEIITTLYTKLALTQDVLQDELLTAIANEAFNEYVNEVRQLSDYNKTLSYIENDKNTVDASKIVINILSAEDTQNKLFKNISELMDDYTYLLVAKGIGESLSDTLSPLSNLQNGSLFSIDQDKFANAIKFNMNQDELSRIMQSMLTNTQDKSASSNLISFGYQDIDDPTAISFYFNDFEAKENFVAFIEEYNNIQNDEDKQIKYTDITGLLMSSVKTIVDSVSYVLIAFVSISLIVSSIMIAVITLISVMERTKEIGILRAMGASKRNVSSIFNAETFIIGLLSGGLGILTSYILIIPINSIIHSLTNNNDINAVLPINAAITLIIIAVVLTIFAGLIPSKKASKQDPVIALRTE